MVKKDEYKKRNDSKSVAIDSILRLVAVGWSDTL